MNLRSDFEQTNFMSCSRSVHHYYNEYGMQTNKISLYSLPTGENQLTVVCEKGVLVYNLNMRTDGLITKDQTPVININSNIQTSIILLNFNYTAIPTKHEL